MNLMPAVDGTDPKEDDKLTALQVVTIEFCARVQQRWPATAIGFEDLNKALLSVRVAAVERGRNPARVAEMKRLLAEIAGAAHTWISDPKQMEQLMKDGYPPEA